MLLYYDLHIHSCLSPCAGEDMTPDNICGMAHLKGLQVISVTDHNSAGNLRACQQAAKEYSLLFIPGMELCTREEVHLLAYFPTVDAAEEMGQRCRGFLPPMKNKPDFFGNQWVVDYQGTLLYEEEALLIGALNLSFSEVVGMVRKLGGVPVPAHIHRRNGVVQMLGFIPPGDAITTVEVRPGDCPPVGYRVLHSSDAHQLGDISERLYHVSAEPTVQSVLDEMKII